MKVRYAFPKHNYGGYIEDPEKPLGQKWAFLIFDSLIATVINSVYPQGSHGLVIRAINRILLAMDYASQHDDTYINLDQADVEFLKKLFDNEKASVSPAHVRIFCKIQDELDRVLKGEPEPNYENESKSAEPVPEEQKA